MPEKGTKQWRICVTRMGFAVLPGDTPEEALKAAADLNAGDFDWESVTPELIEDTAVVMGPAE